MNSMVKNLESVPVNLPSATVVEAIAEYFGQDPMDLEQPLYEAIDPDALDAIIGTGVAGTAPSDVVVHFSYNGCRVAVSSNGSVEVSGPSST